jgi:hypothetical protein
MPLEFSESEMPRYAHAKGNRSERQRDAKRKHEKTRKRTRTVDPRNKRMIAWDGEGMKLSGHKSPQHYVLFGCSADVENPLIITGEKDDLDFIRLVDYAANIADRFPKAFHVGYYFSYDQNMIIKSLSVGHKLALYEKNRTQTKRNGITYRVQWTPGKRIRLTRVLANGKKSTLVIDDMASYFATSFVKAYAGLFPDLVDTPAFQRVIQGKADRAEMLYKDMAQVLAYWQDEIVALEQLAERFREIMYDAGFMLREWYGPGALANLIRRERGLIEHEWGGKEANLPPAVHDASKRAYFGGHVEQYQTGRIRGPVYVYDINSAYPAGFVQAPSLAEGGIWQRVSRPNSGVRLGVYRVRYRARGNGGALPWKPQPLPHRDARANTSYPPIVDGWYWTPEAAMAARYYGGEIIDGWEWWPADKDARPWAFFADMYETRLRLKRANNPMERAFKLGLNSMYGKMAQRAGWDQDNNQPPRAHTLPLAGFITSYCRAMILEMLVKMDPAQVVAVETDGIFSTQSPDELSVPLSNRLGDWDVKVYEELVYVQNGLYLYKENGQWFNKTRGMDASSITHTFVMNYLRSLAPNEQWQPAEVPQGERFIGLGSAIARSRTRENADSNGINPFKLASLHGRWFTAPRAMAPGLKGKRVHIPKFCPACKAGHSAAADAHRLVVRSAALADPISFPYRLPWETGYVKPQWLLDDEQSREELARERT